LIYVAQKQETTNTAFWSWDGRIVKQSIGKHYYRCFNNILIGFVCDVHVHHV